MKKIFFWIAGAILAIILVATSVGAHQWYTDKPYSMRLYLDREVIKLVASSPEMKTGMGLHKLGLTAHLFELDSGKELTLLEKLPNLHALKAGVNQYTNLQGQEKLNQQAVNYLLDKLINLEKYKYHNYPLDTFGGLHSRFPDMMVKKHPIESKVHVEAYLARLKDSERYFSKVIDGVRYREQRDIIPPKIVLENVIKQLKKFVSSEIEENILLTSLKVRMLALEDVDVEQQAIFLNQAASLIEHHVYPSYHRMIALYEELHMRAGDGVGYWRLPDGENAYQALLEFYTTADVTANEVYQTGVNEVNRIQAEMMRILNNDIGITSPIFSEAMAAFSSREALYFPDSPEGRMRVLERMTEVQKRMNALLPQYFSITNIPELEFIRSPLLTEDKDSLARYTRNSVLVNLKDMRALPENSLPVLTYHEGTPGHHYQKSVTANLASMPIVLSETPFGAYMEGWGMYAERLGYDLNLYSSPEEVLAYLQYDLTRAGRMVIDTGLHIKRWSRERAIDYLVTEIALSRDEAEIEVDRAIVVPGSGPMYKIGQMRILALREQAKVAMGEAFSLKQFHDDVLNSGALPLDLLEQNVTESFSDL